MRAASTISIRAATLSLALLVATASATSPVPGGTSLDLDGQTSAVGELGQSVTVNISGTPGRPAILLLDVSPGPVVLFGQSVPLGITPAVAVVPVGNIPAGGTISLSLNLPANTTAHGAQIFFAAVVDETGTRPGLSWSNGADLTLADRAAQLAGNALAQFPFFEYVRAINRGSSTELAVDPTRYPFVTGKTASVYVTASKTRAQWDADPSLVDVRGTPQSVTFNGPSIQASTAVLDAGTLLGPDESASSGDARVGVGYDVVVDFDGNGQLSGPDLIDGYDAVQAGFYIVRDTARGGLKTAASQGPYAVTEILYSGGSFLGQDTYYPTNIAAMGELPLVVVSHGNGHNYQWYDHIGYHLASYGYIVMSHQNNTIPGSHTAAISTLDNTEFILGSQATIGGGVLNGHIDDNNITWIGHSRGGDGVARAYDRLFRGTSTPERYSIADIKLISSIAPVDFGGTTGNPASHPRNVPAYHLWVAQSDADVTGCSASKWYRLYERATRNRQWISLYGVGHGDYHDGGGSSVASGPCLVGRAQTHTIVRGYLLPLVEHFVRGDVPSRDFLWRQYESFHAVGSAEGTCVSANLAFQDEPASGKLVIDDFQSNPDPGLASSGATVAATVNNYREGRLADVNSNFTWMASDPFNGFIHDSTTASTRTDSFGVVFDYEGNSSITYSLQPGQRDFRPYVYLALRAAQGTRNPFTIAELGDITFTVMLEDGDGDRASMNIGAYGGGVEEPYQRTSCGTGTGWTSEFEIIRLRLTDFLNNGNALDLSDITELTFQFGPSFGSRQGRLALDEIELTGR
ncbi:MAG: hypothetical protein AAF628_19310 [Planctomycetota bacterium]